VAGGVAPKVEKGKDVDGVVAEEVVMEGVAAVPDTETAVAVLAVAVDAAAVVDVAAAAARWILLNAQVVVEKMYQ